MDSDMRKILNEELIELKQMTRLAEQRLDIQREELSQHTRMFQKMEARMDKQAEMLDRHGLRMDELSEINNRHQAGFEILFKGMTGLEERLDLEIARLKNK